MKNKQKYLNMRDTVNRHLKAEWTAIQSMGPMEGLGILYSGADVAGRKAQAIKKKSYGTEIRLETEVVDYRWA